MSLLTAPLLPFAFLRRILARPLSAEDLRPAEADPAREGFPSATDPALRAARARTEAQSYLTRRQAELQAELEARR